MATAQQKSEREYRIKVDEVPVNAQEYIQNNSFPKKIKWYRELGINTSSYEAKTKINNHKFSIEFNNDGVLEDIEITIKWSDVPAALKAQITTVIKSKSDKHRIKKIEYQIVERPDLLTRLTTATDFTAFKPNIELIVQERLDGVYNTFEYQFDFNGKLRSKREIIEHDAHNIEY